MIGLGFWMDNQEIHTSNQFISQTCQEILIQNYYIILRMK